MYCFNYILLQFLSEETQWVCKDDDDDDGAIPQYQYLIFELCCRDDVRTVSGSKVCLFFIFSFHVSDFIFLLSK